MKSIFIIFLTVILTFGCAHKSHKPESNVNVTKSLKGHKYGNIYFSGQPGGKAIKELKEEGFVAVINMREKTEGKYQEFWEQGAVGGQDIAYYNLPYSMKDKLSDEYIDSVTEKVMKHRNEGKILIHCGSGQRVGLWVGAHFHKDHGLSKEEAMTIAKKLGITSPQVETKLVEYLER